LAEWEQFELARDDRFAKLVGDQVRPYIRQLFEDTAAALVGNHQRAVPDTLTAVSKCSAPARSGFRRRPGRWSTRSASSCAKAIR
jgi:hypothetical protein